MLSLNKIFLSVCCLGLMTWILAVTEINSFEPSEYNNKQAFIETDPHLYISESYIVKSSILPIENNYFLSLSGIKDLSKNKFLLINGIIALAFLILATKLKLEVNIYRFFNKDHNGEIVFSDSTAKSVHYITAVSGKISKVIGVSFALLTVITFVF